MALNVPVGKSHHLCITFDFMCYTERPTKVTSKLLYHKGNYDGVNNLEDMWFTFMNNIKLLTEKYIPKSKPRQGNTRPIYMTVKARGKVKDKTTAFNNWRRSREGRDYLKYTKARNQAKWECRKAKKEFERKLAKECKNNPKVFY